MSYLEFVWSEGQSPRWATIRHSRFSADRRLAPSGAVNTHAARCVRVCARARVRVCVFVVVRFAPAEALTAVV